MPRRLAALAAAAVLCLPAFASGAPAAPQITDATGDAIGMQAALDIVSVRFATTGTTTRTKVGKKVKTTYTPTKLVVTKTLAAAPSTTDLTRYRIEAFIDGCGYLDIYYVTGDAPAGNVWLDCPEGEGLEGGSLFDIMPKTVGKTLVWELGLKMLPKEARVGAVMSEFRAFTDVGDPVTAIIGTGEGAGNVLIIPDDPTIGLAVFDVATGSGSWKIG